MTRRLRIAARFASIRSGFHHTDPRKPGLVLALATGGLVTLGCIAAFAVFHLIAFKEVAR